MVACQRHRGPDADGIFARDNVVLGHRRLSIIDISGGTQPFMDESGALAITYNGELYNYRELREELRRKGHGFRTASDTEVVLRAYQEWGAKCCERFEGMFAFAIADHARKEVFLARDHFGIKPLAYFYDGKRLAFASEIHALRFAPGWTGEIDLESIDQFLRLQYIPEPATAFRKAYKLAVGHCMTVRMGEPHVKVEAYWVPRFDAVMPKRGVSDEELDEVLRDSVRRHLVADVPFGAFLSGGVDSSLIVSYMAELLPNAVKTFSIGFDDPGVSELGEARKVAERFSTDHHEEVIHVDALGILPDVVNHYGEPFGDQSAIPTWYVSRLARRFVPMVLSGDGGDELFAGYGTYGLWLARMRKLMPSDNRMRERALKLARRVWPSRYSTPGSPAVDPQNWLDFVGRFRREEREKLWRPEHRFVADKPDAILAAILERTDIDDVRRVQNVDLSMFLPSDILTKVDIAAMAFGLEVRPPMLDRRVFEAANRVPRDRLYTVDSAGQYQGKLPLKRLLAKHLGSAFAQRPKQGFTLPLRSWLYSEPRARAEIRERLTAKGSALHDWLEPSAIGAAVDGSNAENTWLLLVLDEWLRQRKGAQRAAA
jgi:asparagine synthase (glutamine-hydrolysing)